MLEFWHYVSLPDAKATPIFTAELHMIASHHHHQKWALLKQTMRARGQSPLAKQPAASPGHACDGVPGSCSLRRSISLRPGILERLGFSFSLITLASRDHRNNAA
jgi:hypothetical protein